MFKKLAGAVLLLGLTAFAGWSVAEDQGYETISPTQPTADPSKIEVIEFFSYGCPHCYTFEPYVANWLKTKPDNVNFVRIPAVFQPHWPIYAKTYYTAETLGVVDKIQADFFDLVQKKQQEVSDKNGNLVEEINSYFTEDELAKIFTAHGVKESDFRDTFNSFAVDSKMRQAPQIATKYALQGVPTVFVNGKYRVNATSAGGQEKMIEIINNLIKQESGAK